MKKTIYTKKLILQKNRFPLFVAGASLLFALLALGIYFKIKKLHADSLSAQQTASQPVSVVTYTARPVTMTNRLDLPGMVEAWEDLTIKAEVGGKVIEVLAREGDRVKRGQAVLRIDPRDYQHNLRTMEARHQLALSNFKRLAALIEQNAIAQSQYDQADATLKELEAALENARLNLARCTVTSPFAGVVNSLPATLGTLLSHGDPIAQVLAIDRLKVNVAIPEAEVAAVRKIDGCTLRFAALDNLEVEAEKLYLASKPLGASLVYNLQLAIANRQHLILPGMFCRADIVKEVHEDSFGVPLFTVIQQQDQQYVFVVEGNVARKRTVSTGFLEGWKVEIVEGIKVGDQVVIVGHRQLEAGQPVSVVQQVDDPGAILQ